MATKGAIAPSLPQAVSSNFNRVLVDAHAKRTEAGQDYPTTARAWYAVVVLIIAYVFSLADRMVLSLLVAPIRRDLGITDTQMSLLIGFSFALF